MSRLDAKLDSHKDAEVRLALEPITAIADRTGSVVLGIIHGNKSSGTDPVTLVMGSKAFTAVARAVLFVAVDPDDDGIRVLGQPKNNLGRTDLPTLTFSISGHHVADTDEGAVWTGNLAWLGESERSIRDVLEATGETAAARSATGEAGDWLVDFLTAEGGEAKSARIKEEGRKAGHSQDALKRARARNRITSAATGFPRRTVWSLPSGSNEPSRKRQGHRGTPLPREPRWGCERRGLRGIPLPVPSPRGR